MVGIYSSNNPNYSMYPMQPSQVFVDYWNNAIDLYETIFSGITLVLTPDSGTDFPELESPVVPIQSDNDCWSGHSNG